MYPSDPARHSGFMRPMALSEVLDAAFGLYRQHFLTFIRITLFTVVPTQVISIGISLATIDLTNRTAGVTDPADIDMGDFWALVLSAVGTLVVVGVGAVLAQAAVTRAVADRYLFGLAPDVQASVRAALALVGPLLVMSLLFGLGVLAGVVACILPGVYLAVLWILGGSVVVVERTSGTTALRRSTSLVQGRWWNVFGLWAVVLIIAAVAAWIIGLPFALISGSGPSPDTLDRGIVLWNGLGGLIAAVLTTPLTAIVLVLAYFDLRVRKEGLDISMVAPGIDAPAGAGAPAGPAPGVTGIPGALVAGVPTGPVAAPSVGAEAVADWDVNSVTPSDEAVVRHYLTRRLSLPDDVRWYLANDLVTRLWPKLRGVPNGVHPEFILEGIVVAKDRRR